jgi:hypothetical protein
VNQNDGVSRPNGEERHSPNLPITGAPAPDKVADLFAVGLDHHWAGRLARTGAGGFLRQARDQGKLINKITIDAARGNHRGSFVE